MLSPENLALVRPTLYAGQYNLLLGSGTSVDSLGHDKKPLQSAAELAASLCRIKSVPESTPLASVSLLLSPEDINKHLTTPYSNCRAGETPKRITSFVWRSAFTFNIDDTLESAYETSTRRRQRPDSINYDANYRTVANLSNIPIVHLHGFVREPEKGYVFSVSEYARVTRGQNPWMHVLSELLASEPFVVAGTSLNESDLEYYLAGRTDHSGRKNRGPSLLIEPFPTILTEALCKRHDLILVKGTLAEFLKWFAEIAGAAPSVTELIVPSAEGLFERTFGPDAQVELFSSFELVKPAGPNAAGMVSPFFYGKAPSWSDLESRYDLPTADERALSAKVRNYLAADSKRPQVFCLISEPGAGKTTTIRRMSYELAKEGHVVLNLTGKLALDAENTQNAIVNLTRSAVIVIDNAADHASSILLILAGLTLKVPLAIVCADRDYRKDHIDRVLANYSIQYVEIEKWKTGLLQDLIERYRRAGLVGTPDALRAPTKYAQMLLGDPIAIAGCRILNNFKPLDEIVRSLWRDSSEDERISYALAALSEYCYSGGIYYPILERASPNSGLPAQLSNSVPLPLAYSEDGDYVLPLHPAIGDRLLFQLKNEQRDFLQSLFTKLANALSPYVNRRTSIMRTPEARLAGRLFNAERVVKPLLREHAESFYIDAQQSWQWNSRYWEQRALLIQTSDIDTAVQFARHAVAIDEHPFPRTTLASMLVRKMENTTGSKDLLFNEVYEQLAQALKAQHQRDWRPAPHPYSVLFHAVLVYAQSGGRLDGKIQEWTARQIDYCRRLFPKDTPLLNAADRIMTNFGQGKS